MFDELIAAYGSRFFIAAGGVGVALLVLIGVLWLLRGRAPSPFVRGGRNRQPRLQVLDAAAVDARRRLVLVRRDGVEHLIMIGGPTDIVIESGISATKMALAPNASFETLVENNAPSPAPRLESPRGEPRAIERPSSIEDAVPAHAPEPSAEVARSNPAIVGAAVLAMAPKATEEAAVGQPPLRAEPMADIKLPHRETSPIARPAPEPVIEAPAPEPVAEVATSPEPVAEVADVIELPSPRQVVVEPPAAEHSPTPAAPAFEPRPRSEPLTAFEPVRRPAPAPAPAPAVAPPPAAEIPRPPQSVSIAPERRIEPQMSRENDEADAVDILDAARHRVFASDQRDPLELRQSPPAREVPSIDERAGHAPPDAAATLISEISPVVASKPHADPLHAAKARELGTDFESILEAEMSNNLSAQRIVPNAAEPVAPVPNVAAPVPGQRRDIDTPPLTNSDSTLQQEVARIFGEMSVNRDK